MSNLHDRLAAMIPALREERENILRSRPDFEISVITVKQIFGGLRGVNALVCDTSTVDPEKGLIIRGIPVAHLADKLPEEVLFLLLTGKLPGAEELEELRADLGRRAKAPAYVWKVIEAMPKESHPMTMLSTAVLCMERESRFRKRYEEGLDPQDHWQPALDDALDLIAVLPEIAAGVYRTRYGKDTRVAGDPRLDWAANFAHMMGIDDEPFYKLMRLASVVQSDHEGGHVSALTAHTVGSALSNVYYAISAALNGLAGPLHGLASEMCIDWVLRAVEQFGENPSDDQIRSYARESLKSGRVIPGYGHAVLRGPDPRYLALLAFGERHCRRDPVFRLVVRMSKVIPSALMEHGKVKNPWPNVDAINGSIYRFFGIEEAPFYTVFFGVALSLGLASQYVLDRALMTPITRPRSVATEWIKGQTGSK